MPASLIVVYASLRNATHGASKKSDFVVFILRMCRRERRDLCFCSPFVSVHGKQVEI